MNGIVYLLCADNASFWKGIKLWHRFKLEFPMCFA